jgi:hypothetical protein
VVTSSAVAAHLPLIGSFVFIRSFADRSFRISEESFNVLEEEAALLNVSINTLVDQIIGVHTSYERFMKKFGMMRMARSTFRSLLEISPEDRVAQAARQHMKEMGKVTPGWPIRSTLIGLVNILLFLPSITETVSAFSLVRYTVFVLGLTATNVARL